MHKVTSSSQQCVTNSDVAEIARSYNEALLCQNGTPKTLVPKLEYIQRAYSATDQYCTVGFLSVEYRGRMKQLETSTFEEIQDQFLKVFHREMTQEEKRCLFLVDKYWISSSLAGKDSRESRVPMHSSAILHEAQHLREVSDRLEWLPKQHPLVSEPLITISESVRHAAVLLEVLYATKVAPLSGLDLSST